MDSMEIVLKLLDHRNLSVPKPLKGAKEKNGVAFLLDASNFIFKVLVD